MWSSPGHALCAWPRAAEPPRRARCCTLRAARAQPRRQTETKGMIQGLEPQGGAQKAREVGQRFRPRCRPRCRRLRRAVRLVRLPVLNLAHAPAVPGSLANRAGLELDAVGARVVGGAAVGAHVGRHDGRSAAPRWRHPRSAHHTCRCHYSLANALARRPRCRRPRFHRPKLAGNSPQSTSLTRLR